MYLYIGINQDGCNLPTKECGKLESLFFCSLYKHINIPLSGSAKHMRPGIRLYVCVRVCVCECKLLYVSVMLHMLFLAKVLLAWSRAVKLSLLIVVLQKARPDAKLFLISDQFLPHLSPTTIEKVSIFWHKYSNSIMENES